MHIERAPYLVGRLAFKVLLVFGAQCKRQDLPPYRGVSFAPWILLMGLIIASAVVSSACNERLLGSSCNELGHNAIADKSLDGILTLVDLEKCFSALDSPGRSLDVLKDDCGLLLVRHDSCLESWMTNRLGALVETECLW